MNHLSRFLHPRAFLALAALLLSAPRLWAQEADFPDVDVTAASREWYEEPIVWITSGVILLLLLWVARRRRTTSK